MLKRSDWWKSLVLLLVAASAVMLFMAVRTIREAPPVPVFVDADGAVIFSREDIELGQLVFQKYALMEYGSMFGDGALRGPDFTAETLHFLASDMLQFYEGETHAREAHVREAPARSAKNPVEGSQHPGESIRERVQRELKDTQVRATDGKVLLNRAASHAAERAVQRHAAMFAGVGEDAIRPAGLIRDASELRQLTAFFFWGAWVCVALRPDTTASYTHNWPYEPLAGNVPIGDALFWSIIAIFGLMLALGGALYLYGRLQGTGEAPRGRGVAEEENNGTPTRPVPTETQLQSRLLFKAAALLFLWQVTAGVLTAHDFLGFTKFFGVDLSVYLPITVTRSWHVQLSLLWISACWIGASLVLLPTFRKADQPEPKGQVVLVRIMTVLFLGASTGAIVGLLLGPHGWLGEHWRWFGHQGWEFVEAGRFYQYMLFASFIVWVIVVYRGLAPALRESDPFSLAHWMLYTVAAIAVLFTAGFVAGPRTNFVIADFWRWCLIHMWAECFFEAFTTVLTAVFLVGMGLLPRAVAERTVFFAMLLFLGSGIPGIAHNFYWNAKPAALLAVGSVFSTLQVVPLILLALEARRFASLSSGTQRDPRMCSSTFLFLVGVNFWNFLGAGVMGFAINLPIVNYYEHGTYLTVNHGHAALMGVYGNLSLGAVFFSLRKLTPPAAWKAGQVRLVFWSVNIGLGLMVLLDTLPVGLLQLREVLAHGYHVARSARFVQSEAFQTLTWLRAVGGILFYFGGLLPFVLFVLGSVGSSVAVTERAESAGSAKSGR